MESLFDLLDTPVLSHYERGTPVLPSTFVDTCPQNGSKKEPISPKSTAYRRAFGPFTLGLFKKILCIVLHRKFLNNPKVNGLFPTGTPGPFDLAPAGLTTTLVVPHGNPLNVICLASTAFLPRCSVPLFAAAIFILVHF